MLLREELWLRLELGRETLKRWSFFADVVTKEQEADSTEQEDDSGT